MLRLIPDSIGKCRHGGPYLSRDWFAGFWSGSLFLLVHGRDGILELGQRDLVAAVVLLAAHVFLLQSLRGNRPWMLALFGVLAGFAATIQPTMPPLGLLSLCVVYLQLKRSGRRPGPFLMSGLWDGCCCCLGSFFLIEKHALRPFLQTTLGMAAYHAELARRSAGYLLVHSCAPLLPLVVAWLLIAGIQGERFSWDKAHLLTAGGVGLFSYLAQAKG